jgi:hypothetical protein
MHFLLTILWGPFAAFLPARWRSHLPLAGSVKWERAAALSGLLECVAAMVALGFWYMRLMVPTIRGVTESVMDGRSSGTEVTAHQVTGVALLVFATHPLTWLLAYLFAEGALRFLAAFIAEDARGSFPLYVLERGAFLAAHPDQAQAILQEVRQNFTSLGDDLRERLMVARLKEVYDEHIPSKDGAEEFLEIGASRRKQGWDPPKIVCVDEVYYRLEKAFVDPRLRARPFRYRLRRLEAGVPGKNVIIYRRGAQAVKE